MNIAPFTIAIPSAPDDFWRERAAALTTNEVTVNLLGGGYIEINRQQLMVSDVRKPWPVQMLVGHEISPLLVLTRLALHPEAVVVSTDTKSPEVYLVRTREGLKAFMEDLYGRWLPSELEYAERIGLILPPLRTLIGGIHSVI